MPQRSTEFQRLIKLIEQQRAGNATIRESAMLLDRLTGRKREVDITIVSKIGDLDVIISIEVNEKSRIADVQWIEQQYQKHQTLPTNKLVLVSKAGFTEGASEKARLLGIDAIAVDNLTDYNFGFDEGSLTNIRINFTIPMIDLVIGEEHIFLTNLILKCQRNGQEFDISEMASRLLGTVFDFKKFHEMAGPNHEQKFAMNFPVSGHPIIFKYKGKEYKLTEKVNLKGYIKKFSIPVICKIGKYRTDHVIIATSLAGEDEQLLVVLPSGRQKGKAIFKGIEMDLDLDEEYKDGFPSYASS
jgi:hypothetical protein